MSFSPIGDDHAVEKVTFGCVFENPLPIEAVESVGAQRSKIRALLPAFNTDENDETDLRFSHLRPDGSATWMLRVSGRIMYVECTRYTRWARVWEQAKEFLMFGLEAVAAYDVRIASLGFTAEDRFVVAKDAYDLSKLFVPSDLIPRAIFSRPPRWQIQQGWFADVATGMLMHNLEIVSCPHSPSPRQSDSSKPSWAVAVGHTLERRFERPMDISVLAGHEGGEFDQEMQLLHAENKTLVDHLLADNMKERIKLWRES